MPEEAFSCRGIKNESETNDILLMKIFNPIIPFPKSLLSGSAKCLLGLLLLSISFPSTVMSQQNTTLPPLPDYLQKFINVPTWYLNYRMYIKAECMNGPGTCSVEREINGTMILGLRSQGPSLSMPEIAPKLNTPEAFERMIGHYANWMPGVAYDETKSGAENDAAQMQAMEANRAGRGSLKYSYMTPDPNGSNNHGSAAGTGEIWLDGNIALEFDAEKKKYSFLFNPTINDSAQSEHAIQGSETLNEGSNSEEHRKIDRAFFPGFEHFNSFEPPYVNGPSGANYVEDIPQNFGVISGGSTHKITADWISNVTGTYTFEYTLSPNPPSDAELFIIPPKEYEQWRPMGDQDEKTSGDWFPIKVKLQKKGGGDPQFKITRIYYELKNTSRIPGVCMNMPKTPDPKNPPDLQFEAIHNNDLKLGPDYEGQQASKYLDGKTEDEVVVSSFDYGAYGEFEAWAELENGQVVYATVQNTGEKFLKLPARNQDSHIAKVFLKNLGNLADDDDSENDPVGDGFKGDGLSLYEEYRGFKDGGNWITADPKKKDIFVLNEMRGTGAIQRGISIFEKATGLVVHRHILSKQVSGKMIINFNSDAYSHLVDQHVIRIKADATLQRGGGAHVENVGTPGTAKSVNIPPDWEEFRKVQNKMVPSMERTTAHEMSHDCNIYHHGESDQTVRWEYDSTVSPNIVEIKPSGREIITLKREDGSIVQAEDFFPRTIKNGEGYNNIPLGVQHGQHSGVETCLMRYWISWGYPSLTEPNVRYLSPGEFRGTILCATPNGDGVNASGHKPQSRYGTAATPANGNSPWVKDNRGKCKDQLRVNDFGMEPKR
jgi:hypothetical protein